MEHIRREREVIGDGERSKDDELGATISLIRAIEKGSVAAQRKILRCQPGLQALAGPVPFLRGSDGTLDRLRDRALELGRSAAMDALVTLHRELPSMSDSEAATRRGQVLQRLKRLSPGRTSSLSAVVDPNGRVATDPEEVAAVLRGHWAQVLAARRCDGEALERWLAEDEAADPTEFGRDPLPPRGAGAWTPRRSDVAWAIAQSGSSAPGPDGIPYAAWRKLGPLGEAIL